MSLDAATLDPAQLAAFRQQAGPIVAQERGLTPACRAKLAGVARAVGIAEEQIDAAVRSLSAAEPAAPPNPQAERFRCRLQRDLAGKARTIIGPTIEEQIVANAARKYGLDGAQARQVLGEVAAELGLTRITASDAIDSLAVQIDHIVADNTWLAREAWDRLRSAGDKWGIELSVVEELIDERLAANRQALATRRWRNSLIVATAGGAVLLAGAALVVMLNRSRPATVDRPGSGISEPAVPLAPQPTQPAWWDVDLAIAMAAARGEAGGLGGACDLLASAAPAERGAGYERLVLHVRSQPATKELRDLTSPIASGCLALEPDERAANQLQAALVGLLPSLATPLGNQPPLELSYWATDAAAAALAHRGASPTRLQALMTALESALGGAIEAKLPAAEQRRALRGRVAAAAYHQLTAVAAKEPAAVAARYPDLAASAAELLPEDEWLRCEAALLVAALPAAGNSWRTYETSIGRCISATDPLPALKLLEAYRRTSDEELSRQLAEQLVLRAGVQPKSWSKTDVIAAVRKALGGASSAAASAGERWLALQEQAAAVLAKTESRMADPAALLSQTVELAHLTTLAMALAQGEAGFATFDAAIAQPPQLEVRSEPSGDSDSPPARRSSRTLTTSEQRELSRLLEVLANRAPARQVPRESAVRALAELAKEVADLPPRPAESLAAYLLAAKSPEEAANALPHVAELRRWRSLRLAVADGLAHSKLPAEQQRDLVAALIDGAAPAETLDLRKVLLEHVMLEAEAAARLSAAVRASGRSDVADAAAAQLTQTYLARARLLGVSANQPQAGSPSAALELCLGPLLAGDASTGSLASVQQAARYLAGDDLHLTVAWQRLLIELSSHRVIHHRPTQAAAARRLDTESLARARSAPSALAQLHDQERTLLQLWMLYAPEL